MRTCSYARRTGHLPALNARISPSGEEESRIIEAVEKRHGSPKFLASLPDFVFHAAPEPQPDATGPSEKEMYARALEVVRTTNHASTSHLQRKMGIGCNKSTVRSSA